MKKIIVTGAAGFIGSHMVDLLLAYNFKVVGIDNLIGGKKSNLKNALKKKNFIFLKLDINKINKNHKDLANSDCIFHFAGLGDIVPSIENPMDYVKVNVNGTINILETCKTFNIPKFIYAASSSCYGKSNKKVSEKEAIQLEHPYSFSKYLGELSVFHWSKFYNIKVASIRIFNAYGLRSRTSGNYGAVIGVFMKQIISKKKLTVVGNGNQKRDFINVQDLVNAFFLVYKKNKFGHIFNVGSGKPVSINSLVKILDKKYENIPKRPGEPDVTHADIRKIQQLTGWRPKILFKDGIYEILNNISYWKDAPLWSKQKIKVATKSWFKYLK